ncbi:splicing factor-like protein 1 [Fagus crenata]
MGNHGFLQVARNGIKVDNTRKGSEEEAAQSSSYRYCIVDEPLEEESEVEEDPEEDLEEDPIEEVEEEPSEVVEEQIKEASECESDSIFNHNNDGSEEPEEDPSEASLSDQCHSDSDPKNSNEKKMSLYESTGESAALQGYQSRKKCRQDESSKPESESWYDVPHLNSQSGLSTAIVSGKRRRRSRWDIEEDGQTSKRRKTEWISDDSQLKLLGPLQLPDFTKEVVVGLDSEIQELQAELLDINRKLQRSEHHDERSVDEVRLRHKLVQRLLDIISKLIQKNPTFKPPLEYKSSKLFKKLYIPVKEYPDYNFIGPIIGPHGNTHRRMEKETGAKICVRGKDITKIPQKDDEDLHVYIEADNQKSLDAAVGMIEKLLNPIDEGMNEHKRTQLEELAKLKGYMCTVCHEQGHQHYACPQLQSTFKMVCCDKCGSHSHPTETCQVMAMTPQSNSQQGSGLSIGSTTKTQDRHNKEIDVTNLYVGYVPEVVDDNRLIGLFSLFGKITCARVMRNRTTGISKGFGFVKFENQTDAAAAMAHLNGYRMDGHMLAVRIAGIPPGYLLMNQFSPYQGSPPVFPNVTSQTAWPGTPYPILPEPLAPFPKSNGMNLPSSSIYVEHGNVLKSEDLDFTPPPGFSSLSDFF